jgi:hypothetical protein
MAHGPKAPFALGLSGSGPKRTTKLRSNCDAPRFASLDIRKSSRPACLLSGVVERALRLWHPLSLETELPFE